MPRIFLAFLLLTPTVLIAQGPPRFELTPAVGYRLDSDFETSGDLFDVDVQIEESASFGATFDIPLGATGWKFELLANRQESSFIVDRGLFDPEDELGDVILDTYHAGILFQWGLGQVEPFFVFSGGLTRIDPQFEGASAENRLSGSLGGGVKIFFADNVGLRLEGRGYWVDLGDSEFDDHHHDYDDDYYYEDALLQAEGSVGLIIAF
ncbi:MAG TPA: hypothetical protein VMW27_15800 [Thermoanaerobaculia bacterium]|nr:hypothetical protein [Thermoanaerobaculia bacterium]